VGVLSDRLDEMRVQATSADGAIVGELRNRNEVHLTFAPGSYRRYNELTLEDQLIGLARLLWAGRMKKYYAAVSEAFGETVTGEPRPVGPRDVAYHAARDELVAEGRSADDRVHVAVQGMRRWTIRIKRGTVRALSEEEFAVRAGEAASELIRDQFSKIKELKRRIYV
jgi:hypothetical protein